MPVIIEEVVAEVAPDRAARAAEPLPDLLEASKLDPRVVRREIRRMARRAARLHAD